MNFKKIKNIVLGALCAVVFANTVPAAQACVPVGQGGHTATIKQAVYMVDKANQKGKRVLVLPKNAKVECFGNYPTYHSIEYKGKHGYVHTDYIKCNCNKNLVYPTSKKPITIRVASMSGLTMRQKASTSSKNLGALKYNTKVQAIQLKGGWYKCKANGNIFYLAQRYCEQVKGGTTLPVNKPTLKPTNKKPVVVTAKQVTPVYKKASTKSQELGSFFEGVDIKTISLSKGWYKVKLTDGIYGYIEQKRVSQDVWAYYGINYPS